MSFSDYEQLCRLRAVLEEASDAMPQARMAVVIWSKHGDQAEENRSAHVWFVEDLVVEIERCVEQANRWQAIVDTGRAINGVEL